MRFSKFLMQAFVCLLAVNFTFTRPARATDALLSVAGVSEDNGSNTQLSAVEITDRLAEAKRLLKAQGLLSSSTVSLAAFNAQAADTHIVSLDKEFFLTKGGDYRLSSQLGADLRVRIVRPNGVNTAVSVTDTATGRNLFPLMVLYPIDRDGSVELAFYVSAHPALMSPELEASGEAYVTTMLDQAAQELAARGVVIPRDLVNVAAHLVIVEHTDHKRFLNEERADISREVLALYALNRGDTYRYSVSSAGAGGMIQMIPKTYEAIRQAHPNVALETDFVSGMQNHANALKAMLLYINDTWRFLQSQDEVQQALGSGVATKTELLAAGYNSNPYKLPSYLAGGGSGWRSLIPAETQMYLAIYQSVDRDVDFGEQPNTNPSVQTTTSVLAPATALIQESTAQLMSWIGNLIPRPTLPGATVY